MCKVCKTCKHYKKNDYTTEPCDRCIDYSNWSSEDFGEPPPKPNNSVPVWNAVILDMNARNQFGISKYGTPLQANNGRDALKDAYEEALDLCVYLKQALIERDS